MPIILNNEAFWGGLLDWIWETVYKKNNAIEEADFDNRLSDSQVKNTLNNLE